MNEKSREIIPDIYLALFPGMGIEVRVHRHCLGVDHEDFVPVTAPDL